MGRPAKTENLPPARITYADILDDAIRYNVEQLEQLKTDAEQAEQQNAPCLAKLSRDAVNKLTLKVETLKTLYRVETGHKYDDAPARITRRAEQKEG